MAEPVAAAAYVCQVLDPAGHVSRTTFDAAGAETTVTAAVGTPQQRTTTYTPCHPRASGVRGEGMTGNRNPRLAHRGEVMPDDPF